MITILFFGSFQHYSTRTLEILSSNPDFNVIGVVTTPPRPGDKGVITKTHTHLYCEANNIPVFPLENLDTIPHEIQQPDFIVVAGYGKLISDLWLNFPKFMAINVHQSLLPDYAGRFPAEWAILKGESLTGVTMIKMSPAFDKGEIIAQKSIPILPTDTKEILYSELYDLIGQIAVETLPKIISGDFKLSEQVGKGFYARQLTKDDGYVTEFNNLNILTRALNPWPGVWTYVTDRNNKKLVLKILSIDENNQPKNVLIEGKKPTIWSEISSYYSLAK